MSKPLHEEITGTVDAIVKQAEAFGWKGHVRPVETQSFRDAVVAKRRAKARKSKAKKTSKVARKRNR